MKLSYFEPRKCYRLTVPARLSDDGQRRALYFATREEGSQKIRELTNRPALNHSVRMPMGDQCFLEEMKALLGSNDGIRQAVEFYRKTVLSVEKRGTVFQMVAEYQAWQETMHRSTSTFRTLLHWATRFTAEFGNTQVLELTYSKLSAWINSFPGGKGHAGRRNAYTFAHALLEWAQKNGWLSQDILKGIDIPRRNVLTNIMPVGDFEQILRACAASDEFRSILPVLILQGLAGVRTCELIGDAGEAVIQWDDLNWAKGWLTVRDAVAKRTSRKNGDRRFVILCPAAIEWLQASAQKSGPVFAGGTTLFGNIKRAMLKSAGVKMEQNTLRHSYATYGVSCGSLADVAKNMGDLEGRVKSTYLDPNIEPQAGLAWFALRPQGGPGNVISMGVAA